MPAGKPKAIKTPEKMWELFEQFREWIEDNPLVYQEHTTTPKGPITKTIEHQRALTWQAFDSWLLNKGIASDTRAYRQNRDGAYSEYRAVCTRINNEMYSQKFEGAASGIYNANIIARDLGLVDKKDLTVKEKEPTREELEKELNDLMGQSD